MRIEVIIPAHRLPSFVTTMAYSPYTPPLHRDCARSARGQSSPQTQEEERSPHPQAADDNRRNCSIHILLYSSLPCDQDMHHTALAR